MGHLTAALLSEAGIELRRLSHGPPASLSEAQQASDSFAALLDDSFTRAS